MATNNNGGNKSDCIASFVDKGRVESSRFYYCRRTVLEMLRDRGYDVPDSELTRSVHEFRSHFGQQPNLQSLTICVSRRSDPSNMVLVIFMETIDIKKATIRDVYDKIMNKERLSWLMLIVQSKMTAYVRKELEMYPIKIEIFKMNDLLVNITKQVGQPKCQVLTADEKQVLLMKYSLNEKQLPYMLKTDAIACYYGLEKGQAIKITYRGEVVDSLVTYRVVV